MNDWIRKNMWESEYRREQMFTRNYIEELYPTWLIKLEYKVSNLKLDGKPYRSCTLDIAIPSKKIAIRLNGGYHFSSGIQGNKDDFQEEALKQAGWNVIDFDDHMMPNLWKKKKNDETIKLAQEEIIQYLGKV